MADPGGDAPRLGGSRRERDPRLWAALVGPDDRRRREAARTLRALEQERWYARQLVEMLPTLPPWQRAHVGESLSLLGDIRFAGPLFLPEMLAVPGGVAVLGSDAYPDERPQHRVEVAPFTLAQHPVTQAAYAVFLDATGHPPPALWRRAFRKPAPDPADLNKPVVGVSARDAEAYARWLGAQTGHRYRLPTEVEWMLAARGAGDARRFPWGGEFDSERANGWFDGAPQRLCAIGLFPAGRGPYGHEGLAGNVWEWCSTLYWPYPYRADDGREDPASEEERVMHGGSWRSRPISLRCAARQGGRPAESFDVVGFRLARGGSA